MRCLAGVSQEGAEVELVSLSESMVLPCVSCYACHRTGKCTLKDDFEEISGKLLSCDGFILASPNYIHSVTAQLKALFDRSACIIHCVALEGKYGAVVETSGGGEDADVIRYMEHVVNILGAQSVGGIGSPVTGCRTFPDEAALFARSRELGRNLCRSIQEQRHFTEQDVFLNAFKARMKRLVEFQKKEWHYEYEYWLAKG